MVRHKTNFFPLNQIIKVFVFQASCISNLIIRFLESVTFVPVKPLGKAHTKNFIEANSVSL